MISVLIGILSQPKLQDYYHQITLKIMQYCENPLKFLYTIHQGFLDKFVNDEKLMTLNQLKQQNYILQHKLIELTNENVKLKKISHFALPYGNRFLSVDVIGSKLIMNHQYLFACVGKNQGIEIKQPVFFQGFLVGIVDKITLNTCRICLLSNVQSRVPAYIHNQLHQGIIYGEGHQMLRFELQQDDSDIHINDLVYSSGIGGIYPAHKIIGRIAGIENKIIKVHPIIDFKTIDNVQIIFAADLQQVQNLQSGINENDDLYPEKF